MIEVKKRRKQAVTNYRKRIKLLKSGLPIVTVRKSNKNIIMQIRQYDTKGDKITLSVISKKLEDFGWNPKSNIPTAYLTGFLLAKELKSKNSELLSKKFVLDIGLYRPTKNSVVFAAAKGAIDNGLNMLLNISFDEDRLRGKSILEYANKMSAENQNKFAVHFSSYNTKNIDVKQLDKLFEQIKQKLSG
ncbi:50S ribosomal protein L18 [Candidatus Marsarchaeota archaeon]|nr:50S ribosomal protein L18 [Candidatus Marsarchaeota archaeon]